MQKERPNQSKDKRLKILFADKELTKKTPLLELWCNISHCNMELCNSPI
jgi:hypothetical protein